MIVLVSLIVLLRGLPCFHDFSHGASHPYIPIHSIESFLHLFHIFFFHIFFMVHVNVATHMRIIYAYAYTYNIIILYTCVG